MKKEIDRHIDPKRVNFTFPVEEQDLTKLGKLGKKIDRTRASLIREALREFLERKEA